VIRCRDIGAFTSEQAIAYGLSGPLLRASGVPWDLRKDEPYSIYDRFKFEVPVGNYGDVYDRYLVRLEEMRQSISIIEQALEKLPEGPIVPEKMPRRLRTPLGEVYAKVESPRGEWGVYLVSKGGDKPYRMKVRSPSFCNLSALREMTIGQFLADAVMILGSMDIVLCDVDR
jgi:NADH-quinone oxidoreductase subunit D